jgi:hypothetical protein
MSRYTSTPIITTPDQPKRRYINVKYPEITRDFADIYVYASLGDRYDLIANSYYNDTELWWKYHMMFHLLVSYNQIISIKSIADYDEMLN